MTDPAPGKPSRLAEAKDRVVAVIVGGDEYGGTGYERLRFSVNDALSLATALRKTLPPERLALSVLTDNETDPLGRPTRAAVLERVRQAAKEAGCEDTLLFFFAGHGEVRGGRAFLIPENVDPFAFEQTAIEVDTLLAIVSESAAKTKLFIIDACQTEETGELVEKSGSERRGRGIPKRGIRPMSSGFLKGFEQRLGDAIIFLSCSPGEVAAESPQEHHGAFSYFLARGLRGEADLDADGVVSLAELIQFVTQKVTDWARSRGEAQTPYVLWRGRAMIPLTSKEAPLVQEPPPPGERPFFEVWGECFRVGLRGFPLAHPGKLLTVSGLLLAAAYLGEAVHYGYEDRSTSVIVVGAIGSGVAFLLWRGLLTFLASAAKTRWHGGGYVAGLLVLFWHAVLFAVFTTCLVYEGVSPHLQGDLVYLGLEMFALCGAVLALGVNAGGFVLSLAQWIVEDEQTLVREAFRSLDEKRVPTLPLPLACTSLRFGFYLVVFAMVGGGVVLFHAVLVLDGMFRGQVQPTSALFVVLRNVLVLVWVFWQLFWYQAELSHIRRIVYPEV